MTNANPAVSAFLIPMLAPNGWGFQAIDGHQYQPDANGTFQARASDMVHLVEAGAVRVAASGPTAERPTDQLHTGLSFFDTTIGRPVFWNGNAWRDAMGGAV